MPKVFETLTVQNQPGQIPRKEAPAALVEAKGDQQGTLTKEHGVWVFRSGEKLSVADTNKVIRNLRRPRSH